MRRHFTRMTWALALGPLSVGSMAAGVNPAVSGVGGTRVQAELPARPGGRFVRVVRSRPSEMLAIQELKVFAGIE